MNACRVHILTLPHYVQYAANLEQHEMERTVWDKPPGGFPTVQLVTRQMHVNKMPGLNQSLRPGVLKGLCHLIRITWKWYCCKELGMDMRRLILKIFLSEPSIFNWHLKFLCLGAKIVQIFHFVSNLNWGCSKWVQIALFASWNNSDFQTLFLIGCLISQIF